MKYRIILSLILVIVMAFAFIVSQDSEVPQDAVPAATPNYNL